MRITENQLATLYIALNNLKDSIDIASKVAKEANNKQLIERTDYYSTCYIKLDTILKDISENDYSELELTNKLKEYANITTFIGKDAIDVLNPPNKSSLH